MKLNQLKIGAILSYVSLVLGNIISIMYTPIMLRMLGQAEFGLFNLANSVVGYLGVLNFGLGNAIIRYTAKYRAKNDKESEYNLNGMFLIIYSILGIIVAIVGIILIFNIENIFGNTLTAIELKKIKYIMSLMVFNLAISFPFAIFESIIVAYEEFVFPKVMGIVRSILNPMIMLPLLFMGYKSITMTLVSTFLNLICIILNMYYCVKFLKIKIKFKNRDFTLLKEISIYSFFIFLNIIVDKIYWSTDQFILGAISGSVAVAIYTVGSTFNNYYMAFSTAISGVFLPRVTTMVTNNSSDDELSELFIKTGRIQYMILSFILVGFILVGKDFIKLWAGDGYSDAYTIAIIVMLPLTIPLIQTMGINILQAKNMHKFRSKIYIVIAILNIITSIPLAINFGGIGAAISTGIAFIIGHGFIMNYYYYKKVKINIPRFWKEILKLSIPVICSFFIGILINKIFVLSSLLNIIYRIISISMIFMIMMYLIGMNEYEKNFIQEFLKLKKKPKVNL